MTELYCRFYKQNNKNSCTFVVTPDSEDGFIRSSYKLIETKYNMIQELGCPYNPIYKHEKFGETAYYLTCLCSNGAEMKPRDFYKVNVEIGIRKKPHVNLFICGNPTKI